MKGPCSIEITVESIKLTDVCACVCVNYNLPAIQRNVIMTENGILDRSFCSITPALVVHI